jgi:hypothetical protein
MGGVRRIVPLTLGWEGLSRSVSIHGAPCSSNQVTVRPPRRRHPTAASPATSRSPRPPSASGSAGRSRGATGQLRSVTPHGCPGPSTAPTNVRATRARSARPATVTLWGAPDLPDFGSFRIFTGKDGIGCQVKQDVLT